MAREVTPSDLTITPRDRRFGRGKKTDRWWNGGDPVATALYNALSATFPRGEAFFVESVRKFRDDAPPKLAEEIRAFTTQEVMHSREHVAFNKRAHEAGYDLKPLEDRVEWRLDMVRERPPIASLAATMALEHFTAILAHELLRDPRHLGQAEPESAALWKWHAAEEIEHKGVAYDTWLFATRDWPASKRWKVKAKVMLLVTRNFIVDRTLEVARHPQLHRRPHFGLARAAPPGRRYRPEGLGQADLVHVGAPGNDAPDLQRLGEIFPVRFPPLERR